MKGQILDVYPEGKETFRACVLDKDDEYFEGKEIGIKVVNLMTGDISTVHYGECSDPVIDDVFNVASD